MKIQAFIFNWRGHFENACRLEAGIGRFVEVTVINSEERAAPNRPNWHNLGDTAYFAAQWNKALELFDGDLLFHVQADVTIDDPARLIEKAAAAVRHHNLGVYEPLIDYTDIRFDSARLTPIEPNLLLVPFTDCTCWFIHGDVARAFPRVDTFVNKYGWGIELVVAAYCRSMRRRCARDFSIPVAHPRCRGYSTSAAVSQMGAYLKTLDPGVAKIAASLFQASVDLRRGMALVPTNPPGTRRNASTFNTSRASPKRDTARFHFITYATGQFQFPAVRLKSSALAVGGFDTGRIFRPHDLDPEFQRRNAATLANPRGAGLYLWKPYMIHRFLDSPEVAAGDVVFYCDSMFLFLENVREFLEERLDGPDGIALFRNAPNGGAFPERCYTKRHALEMLGATQDMLDTPQVSAGFIACRKSDSTVRFIRGWLRKCELPGILSDEHGEEASCFIDHRHDQSVLSILAKQAGIPFHEFPTGPLQNLRQPFQSGVFAQPA